MNCKYEKKWANYCGLHHFFDTSTRRYYLKYRKRQRFDGLNYIIKLSRTLKFNPIEFFNEYLTFS